VDQTQKLLKRLIGEDIDLAMQFGAAPSVVHIDPGQLEQVLMNLAVNARDAMPTGGKLTIETAVVELDEDYAAADWPATTGRFAMLAVSDTGIGMDEATRARIFEPFFTTKGPGKGTGLGLATVYGIVKQSGGFIWAYSEPGKGATFKIYLPLHDGAPTTAHEEREGPPAVHGSETVLLVEDSDDVRYVARKTLEQHGYEVMYAPSASAALSLAAQLDRPVHLLLTDVVMPEMSGRVLAEKFATFQPHAKVLYMSGYTDDAIIRHGVLRAKIPFLQKPFTPLALATRVREVLDTWFKPSFASSVGESSRVPPAVGRSTPDDVGFSLLPLNRSVSAAPMPTPDTPVIQSSVVAPRNANAAGTRISPAASSATTPGMSEKAATRSK
jgi:CheY-like chemotaxis protein